MEGPKYDLLTLNEVRTMDTNTKCNHPPPQFEATKICKFPDGSTMSTFGFTPINCYEKSDGYKINVVTSKSKRETTGIQNICNCTCSYRHGGRDYPLELLQQVQNALKMEETYVNLVQLECI